jgi:diacylglycerol kinase (ATP)
MTDNYSVDQNPHKGNKGITRAFRAAVNSWNGLVFAVREESAFRQELTLACILIPISFILRVSPVEHIVLFGSVILVLIVELLNSSVEAAIDRISFEKHGLSQRAKDFGSAAVMLALILCFVSWTCILVPLLSKASSIGQIV